MGFVFKVLVISTLLSILWMVGHDTNTIEPVVGMIIWAITIGLTAVDELYFEK